MLTSTGKYELRVDMVDTNNNKTYAVYKTFSIGDAASKYKLTVGDYSGNAGKLQFMSLTICQKLFRIHVIVTVLSSNNVRQFFHRILKYLICYPLNSR